LGPVAAFADGLRRIEGNQLGRRNPIEGQRAMIADVVREQRAPSPTASD